VLSAPIFQTSSPRYTVALLVTGAMLLVRVLLNPALGNDLTYATLFAAVAFSAWFCGIGPSIASVMFAVLGARYWLIEPTHSFGLPDTPQALGLLVFLLTSGIIIAFGELNHQNHRNMRSTREELEAQLKESTKQLDTANRTCAS
jgi:K+-sensing histidine kinase KdpD